MKNSKILIVDDNHINRVIIKKILENKGYTQLITAGSAKEAFEYLGVNQEDKKNGQDVSIDLILTDLMMPEIDGIEFCRKIRCRKRFDNIPIIVITASSNIQDLQETFKIGISDYITKPINPIEVMTRIESVLKLKMETDKRMQQEKELLDDLKMARKIQMNMLPNPLEEEKIHIKGYYHPEAFLGGDLYYWQKINEKKYGLILFDVMGHGTATSMICMYIRSLLPGIMNLKNPEDVIKELNRHMINFNSTNHHDMDYYFTAIYLLMDIDKKTIEYVNAGHPRGMMLYENGSCHFLEEGCLPIGIVGDLEINTGYVSYKEPFEIFIYSDGISDLLGLTKDEVLENIQFYHQNDSKKFHSFFDYLVYNIQSLKGKDDISIIHGKINL